MDYDSKVNLRDPDCLESLSEEEINISSDIKPIYECLIEYQDISYEGDCLEFYERELIALKYAYIRRGQILYDIFKDRHVNGKLKLEVLPST
jgi:hypothetical protein